MAVRADPNPEKFGVVTVQKGWAAEIVEKPVVPKSRWVNAGCYRFSPRIFGFIARTKKNPLRGEFELTDTLRMLIAKKKLGFVSFDGPVYDIGSPPDLYEAEIRTGT
jgi:glucose-1-phosphate thymidylyltransferase